MAATKKDTKPMAFSGSVEFINSKVLLPSLMSHNTGCNENNTTVPHEEHQLFILPEYMSSSPVFSRVRVARSLVFCVVLCR